MDLSGFRIKGNDMTTRKQWLDIARRCEEATVPENAINLKIGIAVGNHHHNPYTGCLTTITSLIGEKLPGVRYTLWVGERYITAQVGDPSNGVDAATPALAMCASFARAMADMEGA
jgi:hypothetical protein